MKKSLPRLFAIIACFIFGGGAWAQINITTPGQDVRIGKDGGVTARSDGTTSSKGNQASVIVGGISDDAGIEGVTVINGHVSIDGKDVPPSITRYKSPKTGKTYLIQRKGGSVSVSEAGD